MTKSLRLLGLAWLILMAVSGCRDAAPPQASPTPDENSEEALLIQGTTPTQRMIQGGERRCGESVKHEFVITAWKHAPVKIKNVRLGCGCGTLAPDLVGYTLQPGQTVRLTLDLTSHDRAGEVVAVVAVDMVTMEKSCTCHFGVTYHFFGAPAKGPDQVSLAVALGERPQHTFRITRWRQPTEPPLVWNAAASNFGPWQARLVRSDSSPVKQYEGQIRPLHLDTFDFEITHPGPLPVGEHAFTASVAFEGLESVKVPVHVTVLHPLRPSLTSLFAGQLEPGQTWNYTVRWQRAGRQQVRVASVTTNHEAIAASATADFLFVKVVAPQEAGRFSGHIELRFDSPDAPPLRIPVSGIVRPKTGGKTDHRH